MAWNCAARLVALFVSALKFVPWHGLDGFRKALFKWRCVTDRWEAALWLSICRMFLLCLKPRTKLMRCQVQYLRAIQEARNMIGTVEFTLCAVRVIKPIDFVPGLAGLRNRDCARTKAWKRFKQSSCTDCVACQCPALVVKVYFILFCKVLKMHV